MICGAVAPYNKILGGKLISMLMASPEVNEYAAAKYKNTPSIIASSIKGDIVIRKSDIVLLDTTSLYGQSPNQYTRSKIDTHLVNNTKSEIKKKQKFLTEVGMESPDGALPPGWVILMTLPPPRAFM
mgnify:CR=1 FL=1